MQLVSALIVLSALASAAPIGNPTNLEKRDPHYKQWHQWGYNPSKWHKKHSGKLFKRGEDEASEDLVEEEEEASVLEKRDPHFKQWKQHSNKYWRKDTKKLTPPLYKREDAEAEETEAETVDIQKRDPGHYKQWKQWGIKHHKGLILPKGALHKREDSNQEEADETVDIEKREPGHYKQWRKWRPHHQTGYIKGKVL